ncbi:MAG TPA: M42 family metallopeptidase [Saprospiraceae bacterium]|nr:M42 family metallopeptidase [Saprospiraceae bacterium]
MNSTDINFSLLKALCETPGTSGREQAIRARIGQELKGLVDKVYTDPMGNLVAFKKGKQAKKVMVAAHMDEIGFIVSHIDDEGFVRFQPIGGFDPKTLTSQRVIVHGKKDLLGVMGSKPIHIMTPEERNKPVPLNDYFIDLGLPKEQVKELISIGDPITRKGDLMDNGYSVNGKSMDNRVSVFILLEVLRELKDEEVPYDIYGVFTVQEEVGLRGAATAANHIEPDFGFGLDVTIAFDVPGANAQDMVTRMGKGAAIKVMDGSVICDYRMVNYMKQVADRHDIPWQLEILPKGGTDTGNLQRFARKGVIAGAVSIPLRHIHQTIEMASKSDINHCIQLLKGSLTELDGYNWSFDNEDGSKKASDQNDWDDWL